MMIEGKNSPAILYDILVIKSGNRTKFDWGNDESGWYDKNRELIESAEHIWLVPKSGVTKLPLVSVKIDGTKRPIVFSRVHGSTRVGLTRQTRFYALGWQDTVGGKNVRSLMWIYPSGEIEVADNPSFVNVFV